MEQLPTLEEVISFIKGHLKIIVLTIIAGIVFYGLGVGYTIYSNSKALSQEVKQSQNIDSKDLILNQKELDELQKNIVSFDFYVESKESVQFVNYNLLKELLITPETIELVQDKAGMKIEPTPSYAVNVSLDHKTYLLTISIGTGNYKMNKSIANAYYSLIRDGDISFFNNKAVYMSTPPSKNTKEMIINEGTLNEQNIGISPKKMIVYGVLTIVFSSILGLIIAIVYSMTRKEISDSFNFAYKEDDILLNFTSFKSFPTEEVNEKIIHAIIHPKRSTKLLLSEVDLNEKIINGLQEELNKCSQKLKEQMPVVLVARDMSKVNPLVQIDEVVILAKKKETTKIWYKNQRIQLENYHAPVKVIQI